MASPIPYKCVVRDLESLQLAISVLRTSGRTELARALEVSSIPVPPDVWSLEELTTEVNKLHSLLQDPQPSMLSWHSFLNDRLKSLMNVLVNSVG